MDNVKMNGGIEIKRLSHELITFHFYPRIMFLFFHLSPAMNFKSFIRDGGDKRKFMIKPFSDRLEKQCGH